ncbi:MAG: exonuclease domain-containing protein [Thermoflexales bacterium]|nr:exonuclease domain-containing protein [Thermoflexales bacterium]
MQTLVSLDIETTGTDPTRDAIIEVGLVRFRGDGDGALETWSALVNPNRPIPARIVELTGITDTIVQQEGLHLAEVVRILERKIGDAPIVGHNISFDLSFFQSLKHRPAFLQNPAIDTFELASILVPFAGRYALESLAALLDIPLSKAHRALNDAHAAALLYQKLFARALELPREVVNEIARFATQSNWSLALFWREVSEAQSRGTFSTTIGTALQAHLVLSAAGRMTLQRQMRRTALNVPPLKPKPQVELLDVEALAALLDEGGAFARQFPNYELRPPQIQMLRKVAEAFNQGGIAMIEAGTGTGKSIAYLVPAIRWAIQNGRRVVVSTNTINLQEQLAEKDVPAVTAVLGEEVRVAVMKGKGRYLCPHRLEELRRVGPRTVDEARVLAKVMIWLPNSLTGESDELFLPTPGERAVFQHLSAQNPVCTANMCAATDCFFHQARRIAESAHVVIVNHALLLADVMVENRALPEYDYLIVDEAHHLEATATEALTVRVELDEIQRQLSELSRVDTRRKDSETDESERADAKRKSGVISEIMDSVRKVLPTDQSALVITHCDEALRWAAEVRKTSHAAFDALAEFAAENAQQDNNEYAQHVRLSTDLRRQPAWDKVELAFEPLLDAMDELAKALHGLLRVLNEASVLIPSFDPIATRVYGAHRFFSETSAQLRAAIHKPSDQHIYWVTLESSRRNDRTPRVVVSAAPLHVGPTLHQELWSKKAAVVLTSATLRTARGSQPSKPSFDYMKERLHAFDAETLALDSPFDYRASTLVFIVSDIPEPNQVGYHEALQKGLYELFRASRGRGMALFTSYSALRNVARELTPALLREGILVFEQSNGASRRAMIEGFRAAERAVILGTKSFWEGVDIQGDQLSVLAICKLPFDVPSDPVIAARSEAFADAFSEYSLPESVLRFRQGFGRLIRSKTDRGVVVVFDRRVLTRSYGDAFLSALPNPTVVREPLHRLASWVQRWLQQPEPVTSR